MYFYAEEGGTPTPYMGAHWRHLANTISHLNYLLRRRCGLMSNYFDHLVNFLKIQRTNKNKLECGPMPNVMVALPNTGGARCSTLQSLVDGHY